MLNDGKRLTNEPKAIHDPDKGHSSMEEHSNTHLQKQASKNHANVMALSLKLLLVGD